MLRETVPVWNPCLAMTANVSFRPELRPISGSGIVPIKVKNPRGGLITILEVDPSKTTVSDVKQLLYKRNAKFTVERQRYTYKPEDQRHQVILKDRYTLSSYKVGSGDTIVFRDLGIHYPWKTEYRVETILLLSSYILFYAFQEAYRPTHTVYNLQKILLGLWILPHGLALLETMILPTSKRLAPFALTLKVALPHSVLAMLVSYLVNGPLFTPPTMLGETLTQACIGVVIIAHLLRFILHLCRRSSIPYDFSYPQALLEIVAWSAFFCMLDMWIIGPIFVCCTIWKHYIYWRIRSDNS